MMRPAGSFSTSTVNFGQEIHCFVECTFTIGAPGAPSAFALYRGWKKPVLSLLK